MVLRLRRRAYRTYPTYRSGQPGIRANPRKAREPPKERPGRNFSPKTRMKNETVLPFNA